MDSDLLLIDVPYATMTEDAVHKALLNCFRRWSASLGIVCLFAPHGHMELGFPLQKKAAEESGLVYLSLIELRFADFPSAEVIAKKWLPASCAEYLLVYCRGAVDSVRERFSGAVNDKPLLPNFLNISREERDPYNRYKPDKLYDYLEQLFPGAASKSDITCANFQPTLYGSRRKGWLATHPDVVRSFGVS